MTRPIDGTEPVGGGLPYSDAQAVDAVTAWREPQPPVINPVPIPVTLATFIVIATMTTSVLVGGVYRFTLATLASGTNAGSLIEMRLFVDGVDLFATGPLYSFGSSSAKIPFTGDFPLNLAPGQRLIEVRARHPVSPGTASVDFSSLMLERYL